MWEGISRQKWVTKKGIWEWQNAGTQLFQFQKKLCLPLWSWIYWRSPESFVSVPDTLWPMCKTCQQAQRMVCCTGCGKRDLVTWSPLSIMFWVQCPLGLATILGLATRNSGVLDDHYTNNTLGLATCIGFSDLNRVDENWSLNPAGTVLKNVYLCCLFALSLEP